MRIKKFSKSYFWHPLVIPIIVLVLWQYLGVIGMLSERILPTPIEVIKAFVSVIQDGSLFTSMYDSSKRALLGFSIGGSIALIFGFLNGLSKTSNRFTDSSIQMLRNIPHLAMMPIIIIWFGIGETAKVVLVAIGVAFPIYLNTVHGIRSVDPSLIEMGKVYGLKGFALFKRIILPGALSSILIGIRYALGIMWMTLIVAETIATDSGIGFMAAHARDFMQMDVVVLCIIIYALMGKISDSLAKRMENHWLKWDPNYMYK